MDPFDIIAQHYAPNARLTTILLDHSRRVADKAAAISLRMAHLNLDTDFIYQAGILHDIGVSRTNAPAIACTGSAPYVSHGVIGRSILEHHGLKAHALVCERHVGTGITLTDIKTHHLPLPLRDMTPVTLEETIVCYADKFFSKSNNGTEAPVDAVLAELARYGSEKVAVFLKWHRLFNGEDDVMVL